MQLAILLCPCSFYYCRKSILYNLIAEGSLWYKSSWTSSTCGWKVSYDRASYHLRLFAWNFASQYLQVNQQEYQKLKRLGSLYAMMFVLSMNRQCNFSLNKNSEFSSLPHLPENTEADSYKIVMSHFFCIMTHYSEMW